MMNIVFLEKILSDMNRFLNLRKHCDVEGDVVTNIKKILLTRFGYIERMNEIRLTK